MPSSFVNSAVAEQRRYDSDGMRLDNRRVRMPVEGAESIATLASAWPNLLFESWALHGWLICR
jgi:hypothetical protein